MFLETQAWCIVCDTLFPDGCQQGKKEGKQVTDTREENAELIPKPEYGARRAIQQSMITVPFHILPYTRNFTFTRYFTWYFFSLCRSLQQDRRVADNTGAALVPYDANADVPSWKFQRKIHTWNFLGRGNSSQQRTKRTPTMPGAAIVVPLCSKI